MLADQRGRRQAVQVGARFHANDVEAVTAAAHAGLGLALLPGYLCEPAVAEGRLVHVLERMRIARIRALATFLQQRLQGAPSTPRGH